MPRDFSLEGAVIGYVHFILCATEFYSIRIVRLTPQFYSVGRWVQFKVFNGLFRRPGTRSRVKGMAWTCDA